MNIKTEVNAFLAAHVDIKPNHLATAADIRVDYITRLLRHDNRKDMRSENADKLRKAMAKLSPAPETQPQEAA